MSRLNDLHGGADSTGLDAALAAMAAVLRA
jgi:hypothetical protein